MVEGKDKRPDIRSYHFNALADVAVVHPCSRAYLHPAAAERGAAAAMREREKFRKYKECAKREGVRFYGFILEGFGLFSEQAVDFLDGMINKHQDCPLHL